MHISGNKPSSMILSQTNKSSLKSWKSDVPKLPKQAEVKRDCVINQQNYNFNQF